MEFRVHFNASDVAALIGRHRYRRREAALLQEMLKLKAAALRGVKGLISDDVLRALSEESVIAASVQAQPETALASIPGFQKCVTSAAAAKTDVTGVDAAALTAAAAKTAEQASSDAAGLLREALAEDERAQALRTAIADGVAPELGAAAEVARNSVATAIVDATLDAHELVALSEARVAMSAGTSSTEQSALVAAYVERVREARGSAAADIAACAAASTAEAGLLSVAHACTLRAAAKRHRAQVRSAQANTLRSADTAVVRRALSGEVQVRRAH